MSKVYTQALLDDILNRQALPSALTKQASQEILTIIREGLVRDGVVNISNFGNFRLKPVSARQGINPQTGQAITIAPHQRVVFSPCKKLRHRIQSAPQLTSFPAQTDTSQSIAITRQPDSGSDNPLSEVDTTVAVQTNQFIRTTAERQESEANIAIAQHISCNPEKPESGISTFSSPTQTGRNATAPRRHLALGAAALLVLIVVTSTLLQQETETNGDEQPSALSLDKQHAPIIAEEAFSPQQQAASSQSSAALPEQDLSAAATAIPVTAAPDTPSLNQTPTHPTTVQKSNLAGSDVPSQVTASAQMPSASSSDRDTESAYFHFEQPHQVVYGESLWRLAKRYYHAPLLWPHIFQANSATIDNPDYLPTGGTIIIPTLQGTADTLTDNDQRHVAKGYYLVYLYYKKQGLSEASFALYEAKRFDGRLEAVAKSGSAPR